MRNLRAAVLWPHRRLQRIKASIATPDSYEEMDGLSVLPEKGVETAVLDPMPYPLNPFLRKGTLLSGMDLLRTVRLLWSYGKIDVVVSIGESSCFWLVMLKRLLGLRKPVVIVDPALGPDYPARERLQEWVLPHVEKVIVYGAAQRDYIARKYGNGVSTAFLLHRIGTDFFDPARAQASAGPAPEIVSIGGDISRDVETLCRAVDGLDVKTAIYTRKAIRAEIPRNVSIHREWISFHDLRSAYQAARIVVVPVHEAIHPSGINALLEAMSMGKPVIASDSAGIRDYVAHGRTAWVIPPDNPAALRDAIQYLLQNPELSEKLGKSAREFCINHCSLPVYGEKMAGILKGLADDRHTCAIVGLDTGR
jgi:glycosyltransferase involved in cell wall biosynthesis